MSKAKGLTDLEGCVLGIIRAKGACTPYVVRREFMQSTTPYWSGSAGAIYPLVARLRRRRLLRAVRPTGDLRGGTLYGLTAAGDRALRQWLGPVLEPAVYASHPDPLRTRVSFLALLTPAVRATFVTEAATRIRAHLEDLARAAEAAQACGDRYEFHASRGAYLAGEARLTWLEEMARAMDIPLPGGSTSTS
jgi:DNA-binding PadR family transcriptional regulator